MGNVKSITGEAFHIPGEPVVEIVEVLKKFLARAESGLVREIHIIGINPDGIVERAAEPKSSILLVGATAWAVNRLSVLVSARDVEKDPPPEAG